MLIPHKHYPQIIEMYEDDLMPVIEIAQIFLVTRAGIYKILKKLNIDTSKRSYPVDCHACGKIIMRTKADIRRYEHLYCDDTCYVAALRAHNGKGEKRARKIVSQYFSLKKDNIVHFKNNDSLDFREQNLKVFRDQDDHIRYHRGKEVITIWDGRDIL